MKKIIAIGEALIDFIPMQTGCEISQVEAFSPKCGGAPCNAVSAAAKLGGKSMMITQLGKDGFGDKIIGCLKEAGVDVSAVFRTDKANTALAFVSLKADGNRDFSFYRSPSADMLLDSESIREEWFHDAGIFHFGSVALIPSPMKDAHRRAIEIAKKNNLLVSFDPNIRFPLWQDTELLKATVLDFLEYADIVKISDEELEFITGFGDIKSAADYLFEKYEGLKAVLYSMGKDGAMLVTRKFDIAAKKYDVKAVDTTGAGDCITGSFLYRLAGADFTPGDFENADSEFLQSVLDFANACSSLSVTKNGAIASYPDLEEANEFIDSYLKER